MPPKLKRLSGLDVVTIFEQFGFAVIAQKGSHIKLRRMNAIGAKQTLVVPNHKEIDRGTAHAIFRQAMRFIPEDVLRPHFFTE